MANTQAIKRRITSVRSTKQITKAMELVSASKLRHAQEASHSSRPYRNSAREILAKLSKLTKAAEFELYQERTVKARLHVLFTSDRGLAGAYNSNVIKQFLKEVEQDQGNGVISKVAVIGRKGAQVVSRLDEVELIGVYDDWPAYPNAHDISPLYHSILDRFKSKDIDEVKLIFTDYRSSISQVAVSQKLLPATLADEIDKVKISVDVDNAIFEPSPDRVLEAIVPRLIEVQLMQAALEASASEQSMRMMAMKSASDNATDLIDDLTLEFNSARQAAITQELAEITGGAAAIN